MDALHRVAERTCSGLCLDVSQDLMHCSLLCIPEPASIWQASRSPGLAVHSSCEPGRMSCLQQCLLRQRSASAPVHSDKHAVCSAQTSAARAHHLEGTVQRLEAQLQATHAAQQKLGKQLADEQAATKALAPPASRYAAPLLCRAWLLWCAFLPATSIPAAWQLS